VAVLLFGSRVEGMWRRRRRWRWRLWWKRRHNKVHREMSLLPELISIMADKGLVQQCIV
jgi:hypothetical protein